MINKDFIKQLFITERLYDENKSQKTLDNRSPYDMDHDRIIFSHFFRRMHDKTQVFPYAPLSKSSQARSRLSHSLEVSCVGRSLGIYAGNILNEIGIEIEPYNIGTITASACLAHDIGNPPFGHSGEDAIRIWAGKKLSSTHLDEQEKNDFLFYEGNAQGFRILSRLDNWQRKGGLRPTLTTLSAFAKYTCSSLEIDPASIHRKKFGYFKEDQESFHYVFNKLNLKNNSYFFRNFLAFLSEAADDICYAIIDVEDAFHLGLIDFNTVRNLIEPISAKDESYDMHDDYEDEIKLSRLRSYAINHLVKEVIEVFRENFETILTGKYNTSLINNIKSKNLYNNIIDFSFENIYSTDRVVEIESAGFKAIGGLLDIFIPAVLAENPNREDNINRKIVPKKYFYRSENNDNVMDLERLLDNLNNYSKILSVMDFICAMTDRYAIELFQRLSGIKLPII